MRQADQEECWAAGVDPYTALADSRKRSDRSHEVWRNNDLLCEWGYRTDSFLLRSASVWMLSFAPMEKYKVFAARESARLLECLFLTYETLRCEVHAKHTLACRWLLWLGFSVDAIVSLPNRELFYVMKMERGAQWDC